MAILLGRRDAGGLLRVRTPRRSAHHPPCYVLEPGLQCGKIGVLSLHARLRIRLQARRVWQTNGKKTSSLRGNYKRLQTGCMVIVLAPVVEATRLPHVCPIALGYGSHACDDNESIPLKGLCGTGPPLASEQSQGAWP